ncbi:MULTISPECIES: hypothetical protein [Aliiglaciecola]|uniref:hypothetical protein n=1 Tax=Aliiglaciecola TaxID=1406885 RepID=UPI001C086B21|nr:MULTISPECIES: hypothetical protein [Aliiglaciecola]MBU2879953.1 hypothetical protein [Aliiglaciecola lipolytica]MDO6712361.1 hypothetical protein [Aliiglaciecola sp. 2_MG-2023]MDO6753355.1 hypothetical protein [Aliiglaciecola sp. 1_MG-2023]
MLRSICIACTLLVSNVFAQDDKNLSSLTRFDSNLNLNVHSQMDLRDVRIGDNVLGQALNLINKNGEVQYISGGNRSEKVDIIFRQAYLESELLQTLSLLFDKDLGFVNQVSLTYRIASRYLDILPVYNKTVDQAIIKYGQPMSFKQVQEMTQDKGDKVRLSAFVAKLPHKAEIADLIKGYFKYLQVTPKTHFVETDTGHALLLTGFRQCYFWPLNEFEELLSLCSFQPSSGNMKGQGITLTLRNFAIQNKIEHFELEQQQPEIDITF